MVVPDLCEERAGLGQCRRSHVSFWRLVDGCVLEKTSDERGFVSTRAAHHC